MFTLNSVARRIAKCTGENSRYALGGVLVVDHNDTVEMIATDGRRLVRVRQAKSDVDGKAIPGFDYSANGEREAIIPRGAVEHAFSAVPVDTVYATLESSASLGAPIVTLASRATADEYLVQKFPGVRGRFPRVDGIFPTDTPQHTLQVNAWSFRTAVKKVKAEPDEHGTRAIEIAGDSVVIGTHKGKALAGLVRIDANLLLPILDVFCAADSDRRKENMTIDIRKHDQAVVLRCGTAEAVLMPLAVFGRKT